MGHFEASSSAAAFLTEERPWGSFSVLDEGRGYKLKRIEVHPGQRLSYQLHHHRSEHWFFVRGTGWVTMGEREFEVRAGASLEIPIGSPHRIKNIGQEKLVFIEVQTGDYLGEDDIVRLEDDFGRVPSYHPVAAP